MYLRVYHEKRQDHISVNCPQCTLFIVYLKVGELLTMKVHLIEFHDHYKQVKVSKQVFTVAKS